MQKYFEEVFSLTSILQLPILTLKLTNWSYRCAALPQIWQKNRKVRKTERKS